MPRSTKFRRRLSGRIPIRSSPATSRPLSAWPLSMHHLPIPFALAFLARGSPVPVNFPFTTSLFSYLFCGICAIQLHKGQTIQTAERESRLWIIEIINDILYLLVILLTCLSPSHHSPISFLSGSRERKHNLSRVTDPTRTV